MANARAVELFDEFTDLVRSFIVRNQVNRAEYAAIMNYVISVGKADEWPLWLDAFFESTVDSVDYGTGEWTSSTIEGPYFKEGAPLLTERPATLPTRPDEPGDKMRFTATIRDTDGNPVRGALLDVWHSTNDGIYTFFSPRLPDEYLLRGKIITGPVLAHWGREDCIDAGEIGQLAKALAEAPGAAEVRWYDRAGHAFLAGLTDPGHEAAAAAADSWDRTVRFFQEHLGPSPAR